MIRKFTLINSLGNALSLNDLEHFGYNPKGLGIRLDNTYTQSGVDSIFRKSKMKQGEFSIDVVMGIGKSSETYQIYSTLSTFFNYPPFTLKYTTDKTDEYLRDCRLANFSKSEKSLNKMLNEELTLEFTSPWYQWDKGKLYEYKEQEGDGKVYDYAYHYVYEDDIARTQRFFVLENNSVYFGLKDNSPLEIVVEATDLAIENPSWEIQVDSRVVQNDGYNLTIQQGGKLVVSSNPHERRAILVSPDGIESNVYQNQDMSKTNFVTAPIGRSLLVFPNIGKANISYRMKKEAVLV